VRNFDRIVGLNVMSRLRGVRLSHDLAARSRGDGDYLITRYAIFMSNAPEMYELDPIRGTTSRLN
jgi:hypothetical protein